MYRVRGILHAYYRVECGLIQCSEAFWDDVTYKTLTILGVVRITSPSKMRQRI
jgi:hypothetical protein